MELETDIENAGAGSQLDPSGYVEHQVQHVRQRHDWDCGVACVMMVLSREQRQELHRDLEGVCRREGFHKSTWTIDLCYLLKRYNIEHCMYTTTPGVNEDHCRLGYYDKIISLDRERVQRRFAEAARHGLRVAAGRVSGAQLVAHLARGPAIVLVDASLLCCALCGGGGGGGGGRDTLRAHLRRCFGGAGDYRGHYVVVVGYRVRRPGGGGGGGGGGGLRLLYRDPARAARLCACAPRTLRAARDAAGTDHDVLLVYKNFR